MERHGKKSKGEKPFESKSNSSYNVRSVFSCTSAGSKQAPNKVNTNAGLLEDTCYLSLFCAPN